MNALLEVVKIFDVEPFEAGDSDAFRLRLEIVCNLDTNTYEGKVYRLETYRLQPTFPQTDGKSPDWQHDALIHVSDDMFDSEMLKGKSIQEVIDKFQKMFNDIFGCKSV